MARGIGENPALSPAWNVVRIEYPATREEIVETAA
jgi:hypothetical protein